MRASLRCAVVVIIAAYGCTERGAQNPVDKEQLAKILLKSAPTPEHALDVQFENKVRLLGYDLSDPLPQRSHPFKVTWYWRVDESLGGYQLFTHLSDGTLNRLNLDAARALRRVYPEERWKKGDFIKDEQEVSLPADWNSQTAVFYLGFYDGPTRLGISRGKQDSEHRAEALRLTVDAPANQQPEVLLPRLFARHTTAPIKIDGKLDEADWHAAQSSGPFVNTLSAQAAAFEASAQVLYDDQKLYFAFTVNDDYLKSTFDKTDDHLWEQDTVEVMVDPDGDAKNYFELQVSPRGVHFDTRYDTPRQPRPFGHLEWDSHVEAKVQLKDKGKVNDDAADHGYVVEFAVPFNAVAVGEPSVSAVAVGEPLAHPPAAGTAWRMNFFVMDAREQGQRAAGWSAPRVGDFHTLAKFGTVEFVADARTSTPAATEKAPGSATRAR